MDALDALTARAVKARTRARLLSIDAEVGPSASPRAARPTWSPGDSARRLPGMHPLLLCSQVGPSAAPRAQPPSTEVLRAGRPSARPSRRQTHGPKGDVGTRRHGGDTKPDALSRQGASETVDGAAQRKVPGGAEKAQGASRTSPQELAVQMLQEMQP